MIYFTSDWHLGHNKPFVWENRGFKSVYDMSYKILQNINEIVREEDELYILGDLVLGDNAWIGQIPYLRCRQIHIILGNHDTATRASLYEVCDNVVEVVWAKAMRYGKYHFYLSHYPTLTGNTDDKDVRHAMLNLHGHTHQTTNFLTPGQWNMYHVGVDSHDLKPVSIEKVLEDIRDEYSKE